MPEFDAALELTKQWVMRPETVAGTDPLVDVYLAADIIEMDARSIRETNDPNRIQNLITKGHLGQAPSLKGPRVTRIDGRMPIRGLVGAAEYDDAPAEFVPTADRPLRGCRLGRIFTNPGLANSSVLYKPTSAGETFTIYVPALISGVSCAVRKYTGCQGTFRFVGTSGEGGFYEFSFIGSFLEEKEIAFVPGPLVSTPQFPTFVDAQYQLGATPYAPRIRTVTFDAGQRIGRLPSVNAATGVAGFKVVDRDPSLQIDPELDANMVDELWAAFRDGGPLKDATFRLGTVAKNKVTFQFGADGITANLQVNDYQRDTRDDVVCARVTLGPTIGAGQDDWSLLYS